MRDAYFASYEPMLFSFSFASLRCLGIICMVYAHCCTSVPYRCNVVHIWFHVTGCPERIFGLCLSAVDAVYMSVPWSSSSSPYTAAIVGALPSNNHNPATARFVLAAYYLVFLLVLRQKCGV